KRGPKASWSNNTLSYAKKLIKEGRMTPEGLAAYNLAKDKPTIDHNIPKDFPPQKDLLSALSKNPMALNNFNSLSRSAKFMYIVQIEKAKLPETRKRRIEKTVDAMKSLKPKEKVKRRGKY
ncbi:MAG: YdeI/OmpD-associated family protein, partial [Nanoarchaeota archaeon]|nr:YdeI/OmpD-associated family protein [Nanoarchaeota archaeon]